MEEMYGLRSSLDYGQHRHQHPSVLPESMGAPPAIDYQSLLSSSSDGFGDHGMIPPRVFAGSDPSMLMTTAAALSETTTHLIVSSSSSSVIKAKIASHPRYPALLEAYIECRKVGAPPEIAGFLEEIRRECKGNAVSAADPELDQFMETYYEVLVKYKSDLVRPFDEATAFLNKIQLQLSNLICNGAYSRTCFSDEAAGSSEDDCSGDIEIIEFQSKSEDRDIKDKLLHKYSGYISNLKHEFSKKKKKGKLPKEARQTLLEWWNMHYKWPYPTESDKIALAESTGLDQKQINNWFINQRKRHWKPSENMQFAVMDSLSAPFYIDD